MCATCPDGRLLASWRVQHVQIAPLVSVVVSRLGLPHPCCACCVPAFLIEFSKGQNGSRSRPNISIRLSGPDPPGWRIRDEGGRSRWEGLEISMGAVRRVATLRTREAHGTRTSLHTACNVAKRTLLDARNPSRARERVWDHAGASTCGWTELGMCHQPCCDVARFVHTQETDASVSLDRFHAASTVARSRRSQADGTNEASGDPDCAETALSRLLARLRHPTRGAGASHAISCTQLGALEEKKAHTSTLMDGS